MDILLGLRHIRPNSSFTMLDDTYESIIWQDDNTTKPTLAEIEAGYHQYIAQQQATQYQRDRVKEYPAIGDQLDALFHAGVFPPEMTAQIQAVKDKYPKG